MLHRRRQSIEVRDERPGRCNSRCPSVFAERNNSNSVKKHDPCSADTNHIRPHFGRIQVVQFLPNKNRLNRKTRSTPRTELDSASISLITLIVGTNMKCGARKYRPFLYPRITDHSTSTREAVQKERTHPSYNRQPRLHNNLYICNAPRRPGLLFGRVRSGSRATSTCRTPAFALLKRIRSQDRGVVKYWARARVGGVHAGEMTSSRRAKS